MAVTVSPRWRPRHRSGEVIPAQRSVLEILLHGVHLHHAVGDGCAGGKHNASAAGQLVQIPALHIQVAGLHGLGLADAAHIPHFCKCGEILIVMRLIDEDTVNAQLFKGHNIILAGLVIELVQLLLDRFLGSLQLLDGEIIPTVFSSIQKCRPALHPAVAAGWHAVVPGTWGFFSNWLCPMMTAS
mgnify:CR=1 FL=1